jgi:16S rRNA (adenine1518-N6/adenine1519-N6)-dimethyltransferase
MMKLSSPSHLMNFLDEEGARPQKKWSQNFLVDGNIVDKIVKTSKAEKGDLVLEIGPGPGALTQALLAQGCTVIAIEKDPLFAKALGRLGNSLTVFEEDILKFPIETFLKERLQLGQKARIISNLPYHITTPIAARFLPLHDLVSSLTFMVQKEVALRFTAQKGEKDYGSLALLTQFYSNASYAFTVSSSCFFPKPKVQSAVIQLELKQPPLLQDQEKGFFKLTRSAFNQRRKMLRSSLKELCSLEVLKEFESMRPEELSLDDFLKLFSRI